MNAVGARRERHVDAVVHEELRTCFATSDPEKLRAREERSAVEILFAKLDRADARLESAREHLPLGRREDLAGAGRRKALPVRDEEKRRRERRSLQSSIPSIGLEAVA
jgi:hypothetical protein